MVTNLHVFLLLCAAQPCPPEAGELVVQGWRAYRADSIAVAAERFARADRLCDHHLDAKVGLAYALLRQNQVDSADSLFTLVSREDTANGDAWDGLALTRWRRGDRPSALAAARRGIRLNPNNQTTRDLLARLDPDWDRSAVVTPTRQLKLRIDARAHGDYFEIPARDGWRRFYVNGVNMGVALPGKFPSEFPTDSATYAGWFETIAGMHANTLRLYTILPPSFYRALKAWNATHPEQPLWLIHGVWTELPPDHDFQQAEWKAGFRLEMQRVVDLLHGAAQIPARPGHAGGRYDADVSRWTLGYIIGREWEPFAVKAFEARFPEPSRGYRGRFLEARGGLHIDAWMAEQCDYLVGYEVDRYNTIRPIAYTNWPTLDPLYHITESTAEQETAWRRKVGRPTPRAPIEYENDAIGLDAMVVHPTTQNPAGWFASYHAYPYYPDFMLYDPGYDTARSIYGRSNYFGYLRDLKQHHAGVPLLLSEYGVPSSRGNAHLQPQGWDHGGHDEVAMAAIDARLTREIRESGAAGGIIFAWIDEWFKKNWIVIDYEIPLENTRQWHNAMDAEQNYGILGMYAGDSASRPELGGDPLRWQALPPLAEAPAATANLPRRIRIGNDASHVYISVEIAELAGRPFPWRDQDIILAIDSYRADLGQRTLPGGVLTGDIGFEFAAIFRDTADAELRIIPEYSPYVGGDAIVNGDDYGRFSRRPITTVTRDDGRFDSMFVITNRARFTRDGRFIPARGLNRGRLRYGTLARSTLSDWYWDRATGTLEVRLPWNLLNVSDPSTGTLLYEEKAGEEIGTARSDGFRIGVALIGTTATPA
ncbi:MAG TPA: hypothetical protein VEI47_09290, partial [Gemmatimonadales bacterium]|nr:hypothetical protein [Gemmatimonadales bacterium]